MKTLRAGVIGVGFFGEKHAKIISQLPNAELVAVCDANPNRARDVASALKCDHYSNFRELLQRDDIDAVAIVVPDDLHREVTLAAVAANKHILLEKPMAVTKEDCDAILRAAKASPKKFMVAHIVRFDPRSIVAKELIQSGKIGEIVHVTSRRNSPILGARHYAGHCELVTHSGVHDLDLVRWLVGSDYATVYAKGRKVKLPEEGISMFDSILALYEFENGVIYQMENSWILPEKYPSTLDARLQVVGTKGVINIDVHNPGLGIYTDEQTHYPELLHWPEIDDRVVGHIREEIMYFVDCIINDKPVPVTAEDGYKAAMAAIYTLDSIRENRVITIAQ